MTEAQHDPEMVDAVSETFWLSNDIIANRLRHLHNEGYEVVPVSAGPPPGPKRMYDELFDIIDELEAEIERLRAE